MLKRGQSNKLSGGLGHVEEAGVDKLQGDELRMVKQSKLHLNGVLKKEK